MDLSSSNSRINGETFYQEKEKRIKDFIRRLMSNPKKQDGLSQSFNSRKLPEIKNNSSFNRTNLESLNEVNNMLLNMKQPKINRQLPYSRLENPNKS